jgi:ADP-heptose:LPS heptosyltransferase
MEEKQPPSRQKILIIRFSCIGDLVLVSPVIRAIKTQQPAVELHILTKKEYASISHVNPYIDKVHTFQGNLVQNIQELKAENYNYIIDLQHNLRSFRITSALQIPHKTLNKLNVRKWIFVNFKWNMMPQKHFVDRCFETVASLGIKNDTQGLDFFIPDSEYVDLTELPAVFEDGYIAVIVGSNHFTKRIPVQKIIDICRILYKPVILLGGNDVITECEQIAAELGERVYNGCNKFSLFQSAYLLQQSHCVLAGDTGLMHIAAALHKPIASVWGNTVPELGMYPYLPQERHLYRLFEVNALVCRPCSKLGYKKCPRRHFKCMNQLNVVDIAEWINRISDEQI